jgi:hypothetical protein
MPGIAKASDKIIRLASLLMADLTSRVKVRVKSSRYRLNSSKTNAQGPVLHLDKSALFQKTWI